MKLRYFAGIAAVALFAACDGPLDVNPTAEIPDGGYNDARSVQLGVTGAYAPLKQSALYSRELTTFPELYADNLEWTGTYTTDGEVGNRNIFPANSAIQSAWRYSYQGINWANTVLAAIPDVSDLSTAKAEQFEGEMLFLRALNYLNLVRYFGGVPIITEPTSGISEKDFVPRSTQVQVYEQIEEDLLNAISLLNGKTPPVGHATEGAAKALLVRAYLEQGGQAKWEAARDLATDLIDNGGYELVAEFKDIFALKNGKESILEIQFSTIDSNSQAFWYFPNDDDFGGRRGFAPTQSLFDAYEANDERRDVSIGVFKDEFYGRKYYRIEGGDDNVMVLRLAEMYLARAEANARLNADPADVRADIDMIRDRAGLAPLAATVNSQDDLISAILQERRVEFAMEGHRFFDLRRNGRAEAVLSIPATRLLFPIPQSERDRNENLDQNPGYN
jgi:hypothetical protein